MLLPVDEEIPFIYPKESITDEETDSYYIQGRFAFMKETFKTAKRFILGYSADVPVWIDEIGKLELKGLGYDALLNTLLQSGRDITFTVRKDLLEKIVTKYRIEGYSLIEVPCK